jgi:predicted GIY-YIG superfamily endonuclease
MPYVYILRCADDTFYTGWALDVEHRLKIHNRGRGARYTRTRLPVKIVYCEEQPDRASAMRRERAIKHWKRVSKEKAIEAWASLSPPE